MEKKDVNRDLDEKVSKEVLREKFLIRRASLEMAEIKEKSSKIMHYLMSMKEFSDSKLIMCYVDFKNEVRTQDFISGSLAMGKRIAVPFIGSQNGFVSIMTASEIMDLNSELCTGRFGISEPKSDFVRPIAPRDIDLIVVPGIAFDTEKNRLGFGKGYYDRFLADVSQRCIKIGLAFSVQICPKIATDKHDIPVDHIITEEGIL